MDTSRLRDRLKRALTENIHLKAISLFIAIVLWATISGERSAEWSYLVPLDVVNEPAELIITNNVPTFLDVRLQGPRSFIKDLNPKEMAVKINLSGLKTGSNLYPITGELVKSPRGAAVVRINPSYITFEAERRVKKRVKVRAELSGKPADDFFVEAVEVIPAEVEIEGGESEMKEIASLKTAVINIAGGREEKELQVPLDLRGRKVLLNRTEPLTVKVRIREISAKLELKGVRVKAINTPLRSTVRPGSITVMVEGPRSVVAALKAETLEAFVNAQGLAAGTYKAGVQVSLPEGVKLLYHYPKESTVRLYSE